MILLPETLRIEVTADDIANGVAGDGEKCPVALALRRTYPDLDVNVDESEVSLNWERYDPDRDATRFILAFDKGTPVQPSTFTFERHYYDYEEGE